MPDPFASLFQSEFAVVKDCAMIGKAARLGWDISPERRRVLLDRLFGIVEKDEDTRNAVAAAKAILAADTINQRREAARDARRAAKNAKPMTVNVNTAVQINNAEPTSNAQRISDALAILDAARARAIPVADSASPNEVHGIADADAAPVSISRDGLP